MNVGKILIAAAVLCTVGFLSEVRVGSSVGSSDDVKSLRISFGVSEAQAARGVAVRTTRRVTRRTVRRYTVLPVGCPLSGRYYYCGGCYYQAVVEGGTTVYIIVTP